MCPMGFGLLHTNDNIDCMTGPYYKMEITDFILSCSNVDILEILRMF